ncbi:MAG: hypothetical protein L0Y71_11150 [Gemmataceae bacterium]|nr:hypothetical protein [Gemmataceae bacterium]
MRRRVRRVIAGLVILALLTAIAYLYYRWRANHDLADVLAELDASGEPWRLADLEARRPDLADDQNAAALILKARLPAPWKLKPPLDEIKLAPNEVLHPAEQIQFREFLDNFAENLPEVRGLADFPQGRFHVKIAPDVISTLIPHVQTVREIGAVLHHDVWWRAQQADFEGAARSCEAAINASRTLRDEVFLISHLVRLAVLRESTKAVERMLGQGQPPPEVLTALQKRLQEEADFDSWTPAMKGERAGMHQLFEHMAANKVDMRLLRGLAGGRNHWHDPFTDVFLNVTADQSHAWLLRQCTDVLAVRKLPPPERHARLKELHERIDQAPPLARTLAAPICNPVFDRSDARLGCTLAGLATERFRRQHERWPKALDELTPEFLVKLPLDPYTGAPLQLRAAADGIVIFSAGPDGMLRGAGRDEPPATNDPQALLDHEFRFWNVDQRRRVAK